MERLRWEVSYPCLRFSSRPITLASTQARTYEALLEAMEEALSKVTPADAAGWFDHCG
jgi:hypothetical protein